MPSVSIFNKKGNLDPFKEMKEKSEFVDLLLFLMNKKVKWY